MVKRIISHQPNLDLGVLRLVVIDDEPGRVILRVIDQFRQTEMFRLEFTSDEADAVARHFWSASTCALASEREKDNG